MVCFGHVILASTQSAPFFWNTEFAVRASFLLHDSFDSSCFPLCVFLNWLRIIFLPWDFIFPGLRLRVVPSSKNALGGLTPSVLLVRLQCHRVFEPCTFMEGGMNHGHNPSFWLFGCACCLFLDLVFCHGLSLICKESCCTRTISSKCFRCVLLALLFWYRQLAALSWILSELFLCCFWLLFAHHYAEWNYTNWH